MYKIFFVHRFIGISFVLFNDSHFVHALTVTFFFLDTNIPDPVYCPNKCGRCYRGSGRKGTLKRHLKHECGVPKQFQCTYCWKRFALKENLKSHYGRIHKYIFK